jgi:hypothetical protein
MHEKYITASNVVPVSLDQKGIRICRLLLNKGWHLLPLFLTKEPDTGWLCKGYPEGRWGILRVNYQLVPWQKFLPLEQL